MDEHLHALAVHAYYAGELDVGRRACERLLAGPLPPDREEVVRRNRTWYTRSLSDLMPVFGPAGGSQFPRWSSVRPGWSLFNPTIAPCGDGFLAIVRSSNYVINGGRYETPAEDRGVIKTENFLVRIDRRFRVDDARKIVVDYPRSDFPVDGLEDCRLRHTLRSVDGRLGPAWSVSATVLNHAGFNGAARIATADLDVESATLSNVTVRAEPVEGRHEKNWAPLFGTHGFVYALWEDGYTSTVSETQGGAWIVDKEQPSPLIARGFRGGSQFVPLGDGGWIGVIHEVAADTGGRIYEHRFVTLDRYCAITGVSPPFFFKEHRAIEFCAGLAHAQAGELVITFGVRDAEAHLVYVHLEDVLRVITAAATEAA